MPEGDTVWLTARTLHQGLAGQLLTACDFRVPQLATADLTGRTVREVVARGKHLLLRVTGTDADPMPGGLTLHTHLRMDGAWHLYRTGQPWRGGPAHEVRVVLETARWTALGYRLPVVEVLATRDEHRAVGHLGPDLLGPDWNPAEAVRRLAAQPDRPLGVALLDQRTLAGLGNLYRCELCFLRGVTPWTPVGQAGDLAALVELAHRLLHRNRDTAAQVTTGDTRHGRRVWVYGRGGQACLRCGTRIAVDEQAPSNRPNEARLTFWCPHCQRGPAPVSATTRR